jgi:hypothetical protein
MIHVAEIRFFDVSCKSNLYRLVCWLDFVINRAPDDVMLISIFDMNANTQRWGSASKVQLSKSSILHISHRWQEDIALLPTVQIEAALCAV